MPFVTEYNTSLVHEKLKGEIPEDIWQWNPYKKVIYFLNRSDKARLYYFKSFCENPINNIDEIYKKVEVQDTKTLVYEGAQPSYHMDEDCERLKSNFVNFKIPADIKAKGEAAIDEFRNWFKENQQQFLSRPDVYQMMLLAKYSIVEGLHKIDYENSGRRYKENLTLSEIEQRIDSLISNAAKYYNEVEDRKSTIRKYQRRTFIAFTDKTIDDNDSPYNDEELKILLTEYYYLFVEPTIFYLKEYFKAFFKSDVEFNQNVLEYLGFKKCSLCYSDRYQSDKRNIPEDKKELVETFGDYEFPVEPRQFLFKEKAPGLRIAFIYARVFRCLSSDFLNDDFGRYKLYKIEFVSKSNLYVYADTKIYEKDLLAIKLFRYYLTKIEHYSKEEKKIVYTTYPFEKRL